MGIARYEELKPYRFLMSVSSDGKRIVGLVVDELTNTTETYRGKDQRFTFAVYDVVGGDFAKLTDIKWEALMDWRAIIAAASQDYISVEELQCLKEAMTDMTVTFDPTA